MRICLLAPAPTEWGVCGHSVRALAEVLASRHEVVLIHTGLDAEEPSQGGGAVREAVAAPSRELRSLSWAGPDHCYSAAALDAIRAVYGERGPDYLEAPDFRAHALVPLQARLTGDPLLAETMIAVRLSSSTELVSLHDETLHLPEPTRLAELEREQLRLADAIVWPGGDSLSLHRRYFGDVGPALSECITPPLSRSSPDADATASASGDGPLRLLYLADLRHAKGALDLAEACKGLPVEDWTLTFVGTDTRTAPMGQSVRATIEATTGDDPRIEFSEPAPDGEPPGGWGAYDILVVPSRVETWSEPAAKAIAAGMPVLATPVGGLVEIVEDDASGWLADGFGAGSVRRALIRIAEDFEQGRGPAGAEALRRRLALGDPEPTLAAYERLFAQAKELVRDTGDAGPETLVTGIVIYFRTHLYVAEAVASLLAQTHRNLEVLIVNDGSFDEADSVLEELAADPRVTVVTQPNAGESAARNLGAQLARGEYVAMLDADNTFHPTFVERALMAFRREPGLAYVTCHLRMVEPDGSPRPDNPGYVAVGNAVVAGEQENWDGDTLALLPRALFAEEGYRYEPEGTMHSDWELYRILREGGHYGTVIPELLADYRVQPDSLLRGHSDELLARGWAEAHNRIVMRHTRWIADV